MFFIDRDVCHWGVTFGIYALYGCYEDRLTSCLLLSICEHLTQSENCCCMGFLR